MKKIFILIAIITILKISTGSDSSANRGVKPEITIAKTEPSIVPKFTKLDGNLFLALNLEDSVNLADGTVIEFDFGRKNKIVSFHVNDINQEIIDSGKADVFVMIHQDLALELRNERLNGIKIHSFNEDISIPVGQHWKPDQYLVSL